MISIPCPTCKGSIDLYLMDEAAVYVGISPSTMKYHTHHARTIAPIVVGNTLAFTRAQLDEFKANRRGPGRPRKHKLDQSKGSGL